MQKIFLFAILLLSKPLLGQYHLKIISTDAVKSQKLNYPLHAESKIIREKSLQDFLKKLRENGFLAAGTDSLIEKSDTLIVYITQGPLYKWSKVYPVNIDERALRLSGIKTKTYQNETLKYRQAGKKLNDILIWYENNGYPFAKIRLDSIRLMGNSMTAGIFIVPGDLFTIDSLNNRGNSKINPRYLYNYLGIKPLDIFNASLTYKINDRIREIPFIQQIKSPEILLTEKSALINLYLNERKASNFNGIIGFLPNNNALGGKMLITGEANLKLRNSMGRGESIDAEWRRLRAATQSLFIKTSWPFLLNTPFGASGSLSIFKKDTTFLNVQYNLGIQYILKGSDYIKIFTESRRSSLISTLGYKEIMTLPDYADINTSLYGLELSLTRLDYRFNPREGYRITAQGSAGKRNIDKNRAVNPVVYEKLTLNSFQINGNLDADLFIPVFKKATINLGLMANWLESPELFENELPRIGGINSLRGFNEESIFASSYAILNMEYRYLLEENSFLFLFLNGAYYENKAINRKISDYPVGFGAGISFETRAGIFSISYALGKEFNNPIQFRSAKIHFGVTSLF